MKRFGISAHWIERGVLAIMLAFAVAPFWTFRYLPTTDGAAHLANADIVLHWIRGDSAGYRSYYMMNPLPVPNWLGHFVLAMLMLVVRPIIAEKLFMSAYLILLPLAVRYAVRGVRKSAGFLALLAVPLSLNWITHQGFYNFSASVVVFFFALGYWLRHRERMNGWNVLVLALFGLLLYAGHLSSVVIFALTIFILACWFTVIGWSNARKETPQIQAQQRGGLLRDFFPRGILSGLALLPAVGLAVWYQSHGFEGQPHGMKLAILDIPYWKDLLKLAFLISFKARWEKWLARFMALLLAGCLLYVLAGKIRRKQWGRRDGFIFIPLALVGLYFLQGDKAQRDVLFIPQRLAYYTCLTFLLFLAGQRFENWARVTIICAAALLTAGLTVVHMPPMRAYEQQIEEYIAAGDHIGRGETILPLVFAAHGVPPAVDVSGLRVDPFFSIDQYISIDRDAIDLRNYEAALDYFPVRFVPQLNPRIHLAAAGTNLFKEVPQHVDIAHYQQIGGRVDNVLIWGLASYPQNKWDAGSRRTLEYVQKHYELSYRSPSGRAELWHWKGN